jgi:hypothetical protein
MKRLGLAVSAALALTFASTVLAAAGPNGTYKRKVGAAPLGGVLKGTWAITFASPRYTVTDNGIAAVHGTYSLKGSQITFHDKGGPAACSAPGTYSFAISGNKLKLTRISDSNMSCAGRVAVLSRTFTKG